MQVVQHTAISVPARTPNQRATAAALESLALSNPVVMGLLVAPDDTAARMVLDNLSGDLHASLQSMLLQDSRLIRDAILAQLRASFEAPVGAVPALSYVAGEIALDWPQTQLWAQAYGNWGRIDSDGNAGTMTMAAGGALIGADALVEDWRLGLLLGFERSSMSVAGRVGKADVASYHAALYGGTEWGDVAFRAGLAYEWNAISTRRDMTLTADYAGSLLQGFGELAYGIDAGSVAFEPYVNLALVGTHRDGFIEQGGPAALTVQAANAVAAFTAMGVRASTQFIIGDTTLVTATGGVAWRQGFGATPVMQSNFAGSTGFTIAGAPFAGGAALLDAGLEFDLSEQARFGVSYDSVIGANQLAQRIEASFALRF